MLLLFVLVVAIITNAQTVINGDARGYVGGTAADTLIAEGTLGYTFRIQSPSVMDLNFQLTTTKVSGTVTNNWIFSGSIDNVTWVNLDTIANSNASTNAQFMRFSDYNYSYLKVSSTAPATAQKASYKLWYSIRKE